MRQGLSILAGALAAFILIAAFLQAGRGLNRSALGLEGLRQWLSTEGLPVRDFRGGYPIRRDGIGLRIVPVYDADLHRRRPPETTAAARLRSQTEYDLEADTVLRKAEAIRTLFVLPKWRAQVRLTGTVHGDFLIPKAAVTRVADQLILDEAAVTRVAGGFRDLSHGGATARIYSMQTLNAATCTPVIGDTSAMVLGRCFLTPRSGSGEAVEAYVLADPDLLNGHGLGLGDNAVIARDVLGELAGGGEILIDRSTELWTLAPERPVERARTWADLARFFEGPFRLLWALFAIGSLLLFWRAWRRFGAPRSMRAEGPSASRAASIAAEIRLLRAGGDHRALAAAYAGVRLRRLGATILPGQFAVGEARLRSILVRSAPKAAGALEASADQVRNLQEGITAGAALAAMEDFELKLQQVRNAIERPT